MENIHTENTEVDENGREVSQSCLGLPTILRNILEQFSMKELMELSLVNKLCNFEARSVMRERGNVFAKLWSSQVQRVDPCRRLVAFASDLEKMNVVPFSGIRLQIYHPNECQSISDGSLDPSSKVILDRLPWKHFSVTFDDYNWNLCENCSALVVVRRILEDYCGVIEDLTVFHGRESFLQSIFQGRRWPRLKLLKIQSGECGTADPSWTSNSIKALVSSAPNLKELRLNDTIDLAVNILEGSSAVLLPIREFKPLFTPIHEGLVGSIRADAMEIYIHSDDIDSRLLSSFMPKLLEASRTTLETLTMDFLFAVPLMCYGICLENVTTLEIEMNCRLTDAIQPSILKLPTGLDFTRVFPKLTQVKILNDYDELDLSPDVIGAFIEQGNAVRSRALPDRAINITLLQFDPRSDEDDFLPLLAHMFPDVKEMETFKVNQEYSLAKLRKYFLSLEEVTDTTTKILNSFSKYHFWANV